jgi:hypothetical protein
MKNFSYNISKSERLVRIAVGMGLTLSVAFFPGVLGLAALLPLFAIYPIMTGVIGWDPAYQVAHNHNQTQRTTTRTNRANMLTGSN